MTQLLPPIARELVELLGQRTAFALCRAAGGANLYIPSRTDSDARLVQLIGRLAAGKLIQRYAGRQIKLPSLSAMEKAERNAKIKRLHAEGVPQVAIAYRFGLTTRQISYILKREKDL